MALAQSKVGIINIQSAILSTKDGQKAVSEFQAKFAPKRSELEKKQGDIEARKSQLSKGGNVMAADQKERLMREIDQLTKALNRETEDAQAELEQEQGRMMQDLGQRMMAVIDKYARDNGYSLILDVSSQQSPVLYAATGIDITNDAVGLYDKNAPASAAPAPTSSSPPATQVRPAVAPPKKPPAAK
ncbi:MAG: OmpH family outer membrane protein [Bryobacteraceae bacterium]